jgi:hypothetical protein
MEVKKIGYAIIPLLEDCSSAHPIKFKSSSDHSMILIIPKRHSLSFFSLTKHGITPSFSIQFPKSIQSIHLITAKSFGTPNSSDYFIIYYFDSSFDLITNSNEIIFRYSSEFHVTDRLIDSYAFKPIAIFSSCLGFLKLWDISSTKNNLIFDIRINDLPLIDLKFLFRSPICFCCLFRNNKSTLSTTTYSLDLELMATMKVSSFSVSEILDPLSRILILIQAGTPTQVHRTSRIIVYWIEFERRV